MGKKRCANLDGFNVWQKLGAHGAIQPLEIEPHICDENRIAELATSRIARGRADEHKHAAAERASADAAPPAPHNPIHAHFKSLAVVNKIIIDQVKGATRPGGGGVQAAAGARLGGDQGLSIALHAPVGMDFDDALLGGLEPYSIECSNVAKLESVKTTPGEKISYDGDEMKFEPVGWDQWDDLCEWEPTELASGSYDAVHVIVEGSGAGEVKSALRACAVARVVGDDQPCIGIEPVFQKLSKASMEGGPLLELTRVATLISPDLATAICMRDAFLEEKDNDDTKRPCDVSSISKAAARNRNAYLLEMCAALFDELCMQPGSLLAIRDGAYGSYLYSRPAPNAPMWQWLTLTRDYEWLARVPAVELTEEEVRDPTGAGNAYAGALSRAACKWRRPNRRGIDRDGRWRGLLQIE